MLIALLAAAALGVEAPALSVVTWRPPVSVDRMWTEDAALAPNGTVSARLVADYARDPLVWVRDDGEVVHAFRDAAALDAAASLTLGRLRMGAAAPWFVTTRGEAIGGGAGLGDLLLDLRATALDPAQAPVGIALTARAVLPTATVDAPVGVAAPEWGLAAIVDRRVGPVLLAANLGVMLTRRVEREGLVRDDRVIGRLGAAWWLGEDLGLTADLGLQAGRDRSGVPVEVLIGGWSGLGRGLVLQAGVGHGLTSGVGAPTARGLLAIGWRGSALAAPAPAPDEEAPDSRLGRLLVEVTDLEGNPLDAEWRVAEHDPLAVVGGEGVAELAPGLHTVEVVAPGHLGTTFPALIDPGDNGRMHVQLQPLRVHLVRDGLALAEKIRFEPGTGVLRPESLALVDEIAALLRGRPEIRRVRIEAREPRQAEAVRARLIAEGVEPERLQAAAGATDLALTIVPSDQPWP